MARCTRFNFYDKVSDLLRVNKIDYHNLTEIWLKVALDTKYPIGVVNIASVI